MPQYVVKQKGFFNGSIKKPGDYLVIDRKLDPCPSWLELKSSSQPKKTRPGVKKETLKSTKPIPQSPLGSDENIETLK